MRPQGGLFLSKVRHVFMGCGMALAMLRGEGAHGIRGGSVVGMRAAKSRPICGNHERAMAGKEKEHSCLGCRTMLPVSQERGGPHLQEADNPWCQEEYDIHLSRAND